MDLGKFLRLLQTRKLYFARADKLGDPFEGTTTSITAQFYSHLTVPGNEAELEHHFPGLKVDQARDLFRRMAEVARATRREMYISCWHLSTYESAAMWSIYGGNQPAIAITGAYRKLAAALPNGTLMGMINYLDWDRDWMDQKNMFSPFLSKRQSFEHEREVRAMISSMMWRENKRAPDLNFTDDGVEVDVDIDSFIEAVIISPMAPSWFASAVSDLCDIYRLKVPVDQSDIAREPIY